MKRFIVFSTSRALGALLVCALCVAAAPRTEAAADASAFVADLGTQALQALGRSVPPEQRAARFRELFEHDFDLPQIARFVLGPQGRRLEPQQQKQFLGLFREFLVQSYSNRLAQYAGETFRVTGAQRVGDDTVVASEVGGKSGKPVKIDWRVINRDGHFLIVDVAVDGVSMKVTQRNDFADIIRRNGGNAASLLAVLHQQLDHPPAELAGSSTPPPAQMTGSSVPPPAQMSGSSVPPPAQ